MNSSRVRENGARLARLFLVIAFHVGLFILLTHLTFSWGKKETTTPPEMPMQVTVKLPAAVTLPTAPTSGAQGSMSMPNMVVMSSAGMAGIDPIVTIPSTFSMPDPKFPDRAEHLSPTASLTRGAGNGGGSGGSGLGSGNGLGSGTLAGMNIGQDERLLVVLDESGSMDSSIRLLKAKLASDYPDSPIVEAETCRGQLGKPPGDDDSSATPSHEALHEMYLYQAALTGMDHYPETTSVFIFTDFEDGDVPDDTTSFIAQLRQKQIKLFICLVKHSVYPPGQEPKIYKGLSEYASESGGDIHTADMLRKDGDPFSADN